MYVSATGFEAGPAVSAESELLLAAGYAAVARLQAAHDVAVETVVAEVQERTGERLLVRPGILDAQFGDLARMAQQTEHFNEAWRLISTWLLPSDQRPLGTMLKIIPTEAAEEITAHLVGAGLLADDEGEAQ
jgi:hypothetical protein